MNAWDRVLALFGRQPPALPAPNPQARPRRRRGYDGADRSRRSRRWRARYDAPTASTADLALLRERSRDLRRNNPYAARIIDAIVTNTVGYGIIPRFEAPAVGKAWKEWADTSAIDAAGKLDLNGIQALAVGSMIESGEVFIVRRRRDSKEKLPAPLQVQVLEADYLDVTRVRSGAELENGLRLEYGIEYDDRSRPVAYWFWREHPAARHVSGIPHPFESVRVLAEDVIHLYRIDRPGQARGVPWLAPVMARLRALDDYEDAALERARVAACFAAFVHDPQGDGLPEVEPDESCDDQGDQTLPEDEGQPPDEYDRIEPGAIEYLPAGKEISFSTPPVISDYEVFLGSHLRAIGSGLGIPYSVVSGDLSKTSFASSRIGWLEFDRLVDQWLWLLVIPRLCMKLWEWWAESVDIAGIVPGAIRYVPTWSPPRREMISPTEETRALREQVRAGFRSWPEAIRQLGYDPDRLLAEIAAHNKKLDELGVVLETDPRRLGGPTGYVKLDKEETDDDAEDGDEGGNEGDDERSGRRAA